MAQDTRPKTRDDNPDIDHEDIKPGTLDRLVDGFIVECECPDCGREDYYINVPGHPTVRNCKAPMCATQMRL